MRQIKFRGKSLKNKQWVYGDLMSNICGTRIVRYKETDDGKSLRADWEYIDVEPDSVGQFTGLTDCNGKEIYEGDILSFPYEGVADTEVIIFDDGCFKVDDGWDKTAICHLDMSERIIVGNVFDNPELIKR